jgi:thioredoxin 1
MMNIEELKKYGVNLPNNYNDGVVICDIYTNWCGPCKILSPLLEKLASEGLIKLFKVDLEQNRPLGERFTIHAIPTLLFFKEGKLIEENIIIDGQRAVENGKMVGNWGERNIREVISKIG